MSDDKLLGAVIGFAVGGVLMLYALSMAMALDVLPDRKYGLLIILSSMLGGALVGYAYVAVWSRWRAK